MAVDDFQADQCWVSIHWNVFGVYHPYPYLGLLVYSSAKVVFSINISLQSEVEFGISLWVSCTDKQHLALVVARELFSTDIVPGLRNLYKEINRLYMKNLSSLRLIIVCEYVIIKLNNRYKFLHLDGKFRKIPKVTGN